MTRHARTITVFFIFASTCTPANAERLVLASASYGKNIVAICDAQGKVLWSHNTAGPKTGHAGHHDIQLLENGNVLFHENWTTIIEMTLDKKVVWTYDSATMNGNKGKRVDVHAFQRLPNGMTMIAESGAGRIIEVDKDGKIHVEVKLKPGGTQDTRMARKLKNGNYLVCAENPGVVTEYNARSEVVWEYPIKTRVFGAIRLQSGNTLIASGGGASVVEVTPDGKVVWEIKDSVPDTKITLKWTTFLTELDNGNFIVGNCHAGEKSPQIFEITRDKKIIWQFNQYETFGNGLACSQVLNDQQAALVRNRLGASADPVRSPRLVAEQLAVVYGKKLDQVAYIPALPLVAKLRLSELTGEPKYAEEVARITAPFLRGVKTPVPKSGSEQAGHLIFAELATRSKGKDRERWTLLCRNAADQIFDKAGKPLPIMPYHNEMSDAVFMAGPILAATGKLTGEQKYFDAAVTHFTSMRKLCLRRDGIYRHSPLCEAAWGRGNGFPALGLALALSDWPDDHPARKELIAEFQKHMTALKPHQDAKTGCWHQVIDHPESYDEYSCTCMIGFAMQRGIRRGWLAKNEFQPSVDRAWRAIKERTSVDGKLVNVCAGTGKQKTLRDYFERPAINGRDDRGGAMGLLFATELLAAE